MKKQIFTLCAFSGLLAVSAQAQWKADVKAVVSEPAKVVSSAKVATRNTSGVSYAYPIGLKNMGMISKDDNA